MPKPKSNLQIMTANVSGLVRNDRMTDRDFLVVPMIMMVEGVHEGSGGKLFYPADELSKIPEVWNTKPVVVYHPTRNGVPVSACHPDVLTVHQVGMIMNAKFEDGKLKAEAWLDADRMDKVDERIGQTIEANEMMEVSTGVFTENETADEGAEWNGEDYEAIARNHRPDHLALLPDLTGACSIEDGGGFLRLNAKPDKVKIVGNTMSHGNIRSLINSWLQDKADADEYLYAEDVYDSFFVFINDGKYFKGDYSVEDGQVIVNETFTEVVRVTEYRTMDGAFIGNNKQNVHRKEFQMTIKEKKEFVESLIDNKVTNWTKDDEASLLGMNESMLLKIAPVVNDKKDETSVNEDEIKVNEKKIADDAVAAYKASLETNTDDDEQETSLDGLLQKADPKLRDMISNSMTVFEQQKDKLIEIITANEKCSFTKEVLEAKDIAELQSLAALAAKPIDKDDPQSVLNYGGLGPVNKADNKEEPMLAPNLNEVFEKKTA